MSTTRHRLLVAILGFVSAVSFARAQVPASAPTGCCDQRYPAGEWMVTSAEVSIPFYHEVLGLELPQGWTGKFNPPSPGTNGPLTGAVGGAWRVIAMPIPGAAWHMQIVETTGLPRTPFAPRRQDVGATALILYVRDIDAAVAKLKKAGAPIVTTGGAPVSTGNGKSRAIVAKDPDGLFVEFRQPDPLPATSPPASSNVIGAHVAISVASIEDTTRYWRDVLGFEVRTAAVNERIEPTLHATPGARIRKSIGTIPKTSTFDYPGNENNDLAFEFLEFTGIDRRNTKPRYQDPGSGGFVLRLKTFDPSVRGKEMAEFVKQLNASSQNQILTVGGDALDQVRRFAIFFQDLNGFILEATQSTPAPAASR